MQDHQGGRPPDQSRQLRDVIPGSTPHGSVWISDDATKTGYRQGIDTDCRGVEMVHTRLSRKSLQISRAASELVVITGDTHDPAKILQESLPHCTHISRRPTFIRVRGGIEIA